jgi:hypothetical protein
MLGVMVLVSLFTGVIITSMDLLRDTSKAELRVLEEAKKMQQTYAYDDQAFDHLLEIFEIVDTDANGFLSVSHLCLFPLSVFSALTDSQHSQLRLRS